MVNLIRVRHILEKNKMAYYLPSGNEGSDCQAPVVIGVTSYSFNRLTKNPSNFFTCDFVVELKEDRIGLATKKAGEIIPICTIVPCSPTPEMEESRKERPPLDSTQISNLVLGDLDNNKIDREASQLNGPKLSVIVPVYNTRAFLGKCLKQLVLQTLAGIEIIIVDDGSTDNSPRLIEQYREKHPDTIKVIKTDHIGTGAARNAGLAAATGEYVGFVDSDDYVLMNTYELMWRTAKAKNSDVVECQYYLKDCQSEKITINRKGKKDFYDCSVMEEPNIIIGASIVCWNKIFRRSLLLDNDLKFVESNFLEGFELSIKATMLAKVYSYVDIPLYVHSINRRLSNSSKLSIKDIDQLSEIYTNAMGEIKKLPQYDFCRYHVSDIFRRSITKRDLLLNRVWDPTLGVKFVDRIYELLGTLDPKWNDNPIFAEVKNNASDETKGRLGHDDARDNFVKRWYEKRLEETDLTEYPRPNMRRDSYYNLNGTWNYAITDSIDIPDSYDGNIEVPYSPETIWSGVRKTVKPDEYLHYELKCILPKNVISQVKIRQNRLMLHFGAVDQICWIYINGSFAAEHRGGYTPFYIDISPWVTEEIVEINVVVKDYTDTSYYSCGKQRETPGGVHHTAQSGIWQTVWMEVVPDNYIEKLTIVPDFKERRVAIEIKTNDDSISQCEVAISLEGQEIIKTVAQANKATTIPIDEIKVWSPETPTLYDVLIQYGEDKARGYFAMRQVSMGPDKDGVNRFLLNGKPYFINGVLDQGYWKGGLYTPPSDSELKEDICRVKELGFNAIRKFTKIEPLVWYYYCDKLGMLVLQDMVSGGSQANELYTNQLPSKLPALYRGMKDNKRNLLGRENDKGKIQFAKEVVETIETLRGFPSIVMWVIFNEGWGQFEAKELSRKVENLDNTRLVDHASGWFDQGGGHIFSIHNYTKPLHFGRQKDRIVMATAYGGTPVVIASHYFGRMKYGYGPTSKYGELTSTYRNQFHRDILGNIKKGLAGCIYVQLTDVEDEANGLYTYDRELLKIYKPMVLEENEVINEKNRQWQL